MKYHSRWHGLLIELRYMLPAAVVLFVIALLGSIFYWHSKAVMEQQLKESLRASVSLGALQFTGEELDQIQSIEDMEKEVFVSMVNRLEDIKRFTPNALFTYIMRRTDDPLVLEFVVDGDALLGVEDLDENGNGMIDDDESAAFPGELYEIDEYPVMQEEAFHFPSIDREVTKDRWGSYISGYAPIYYQDGSVAGIIGIDIDAGEFEELTNAMFSRLGFLLLLLAAFFIATYIAFFVWRRRIEMLRKMDAERSGLVDLAMHQVGAPLAMFRWWTEILQEGDAKAEDEERKEAYGEIARAVSRMDEVIQALREASRVHMRKVDYHPEKHSLKVLIESVAKELAEDIVKRQDTLDLKIDGELWMEVDEILISGVVRELIQNAISYSPDGTTISVRAFCKNDGMHIKVEDTGYGIPPDELGRVFDEFYRGERGVKCRPVGNGLGLFISRGIIRRAGGDMWITSREGEGTIVHIKLPVESCDMKEDGKTTA